MWVTKRKEEGGLGIQAARAKNIALLKLNWRLYQKRELLWAKILLSEYCSQHQRNSKDLDKLLCSYNWAAVKVGFLVFEKGIYWNVGNYSNLSFGGAIGLRVALLESLLKAHLPSKKTTWLLQKIFKMENGFEGKSPLIFLGWSLTKSKPSPGNFLVRRSTH